jgi:hypothetical protein
LTLSRLILVLILIMNWIQLLRLILILSSDCSDLYSVSGSAIYNDFDLSPDYSDLDTVSDCDSDFEVCSDLYFCPD